MACRRPFVLLRRQKRRGGLRQLSLRDPRTVEVATKSAEYNAGRGLIASAPPIPEKALAYLVERAHGLFDARQSSRSGAVGGARLAMTIRSRRETITFAHPFRIKGVDRSLPAGAYEVITDEEMIEGLSFAAYRRVATMIVVPAAPPRSSAMEMISIGSVELADAQRIDACTPHE
jgi:hypothetical protein